MYTTRLFQEGVQQGTGMGMYVWVALIIFFLMVFLGWLVSSKDWLKKEEAPAAADHGHEEHSHAGHEPEPQHQESAHAASVSMDSKNVQTLGAPVEHKASAHVAQTEPTVAHKTGPDDLTTLEGIGPKVAKVLAGIGITTFAGLATAEYDKVRAALDEAGYKYMEPAGWIEQASMAARGDVEGLKNLQASLKGGRKVG